MLFALFQAKFAIITPALITGAFAEPVSGILTFYGTIYTIGLCSISTHDLAS
jgi:ammonia channel protein AmtB